MYVIVHTKTHMEMIKKNVCNIVVTSGVGCRWNPGGLQRISVVTALFLRLQKLDIQCLLHFPLNCYMS